MEEPEWTCKIDEGSAGLSEARWSPDSRHILTTSEFNVSHLIFSPKDLFVLKVDKVFTFPMLPFVSVGEFFFSH